MRDDFPEHLTIILGNQKLEYEKRQWQINGDRQGLRYGENPDQPAALYRLKSGILNLGDIAWRQPGDALVSALGDDQIIQGGKHPGKTNLTDVDNGANILQYLSGRPACVILKHNNPCGAAWAKVEAGGITEAISRAFWGDRIAAFGGALVVNSPLTLEGAHLISANYFEVVAAPAFEEGAVQQLKKRKNLRILQLPGLARLDKLATASWLDIKCLADGGMILQKSFHSRINDGSDFLPACASTSDGMEVVAKRPSPAELDDLFFAWAVEAGVSSNSVIFAKDGATIAIGTGQQDRVGCVELAIQKAYAKHADALAFKNCDLSLYELRRQAADDHGKAEILARIEEETAAARGGLPGSRLVSDGFFPFRDGVDLAIAQGITAVAQPGGSLRDAEVIMACNEAVPQVSMVFTGQRSFRH